MTLVLKQSIFDFKHKLKYSFFIRYISIINTKNTNLISQF